MKKSFSIRNIVLGILLLTLSVILSSCNSTNSSTSSLTDMPKDIRVSYIDVGQGDSILIQQGEHSMLIDAGKNDAGDTVVDYLKRQGIVHLDYIIATHPHEDHIGGIDNVIQNFDISTIYMPKVTANTRTFRDLVMEIKNKKLEVKSPISGDTFNLGSAECKILAPNSNNYEDLNNYSIVLKVSYGKDKFLFMGDAEEQSENEMLQKGYDVSANFLKVGHHGSHSSTSWNFLNKVNPDIAVISLGKNNDYGHPHKETLESLKKKGVQVLRTDQSGNIIIESDGNGNIKIGKSKGGNVAEESNLNKDNASISNPKEQIYEDSTGKGIIKGNINSKGEKIYHLPNDRYYNRVKPEKWFKTIDEAEKAGFRHSKN